MNTLYKRWIDNILDKENNLCVLKEMICVFLVQYTISTFSRTIFYGEPLMYRVFIKYCVFSKEYSGPLPFSVFPWYQCVYTHQAGRKPALQQNRQSSEKS